MLLCVMAVLGQIGAPALAWCLHDGAGAHVESAPTRCDHQVPHHQMIDAQDPGSAAAQSGGAVTAPCVAIVGHLLPIGWLELAATIHADRRRIAEARPPPRIEQLSGHTTRLLI